MPLISERNCDIRRMIWIHAGDIWLISWPAKFCPPAPRTKTLHASHYQWNSILCTISLSSCNHIPHAHFNIRPGYLKKWVTAHDSRGFNGLLHCNALSLLSLFAPAGGIYGWFYHPTPNLMTLLITESTHLGFTHMTFVFIGLKKGLVP